LSWLLFARNKKVIEFLLGKYDENLAQISNDLRSFVLVAKIKKDSKKFFHKCVESYKNTEDPELLEDLETAITSVEDEKLVEATLELLKDFDFIRPQDTTYVFAELFRNKKAQKPSWQFARDNWDWLEKNFGGGKSLDYYPRVIASVFKTSNDLTEFTEFFEIHKNKIELKRSIEMGKEEIEMRIKLINSNKDGVLQTIEEYIKIESCQD